MKWFIFKLYFRENLTFNKNKPDNLKLLCILCNRNRKQQSIWKGRTWIFTRPDHESWHEHTPLHKTHVPIFRGMVVTHLLLNKANFLTKQEIIWCCIYSFLFTPAFCVFWHHTSLVTSLIEETGLYYAVTRGMLRTTCHTWTRENLPFALCVDPGLRQLTHRACAQPATSPVCGCSPWGSHSWNHFSLKLIFPVSTWTCWAL